MTAARSRTDEVIDRIAARQHGVVTRQQMLRAGLSAALVNGRVRRGRLRPLYRGVYQTGSVLGGHGRAMAAVLACGPTALVSHTSAAVLRSLLRGDLGAGTIDISIAAGRRRHADILLHRSSTLTRYDRSMEDGVPVTSVARTLLDLAATAAEKLVARAVGEALVRRLTTEQRLLRYLNRVGRAAGAARLRVLLGGGGVLPTRSMAEDRFADLIARAELPKPRANVEVGGHEVDFYWPAARLVVQVDGFRYHRDRLSFDTDRAKDARMSGTGIAVQRVTWEHLQQRPEAVVAWVTAALAARGGLKA